MSALDFDRTDSREVALPKQRADREGELLALARVESTCEEGDGAPW